VAPDRSDVEQFVVEFDVFCQPPVDELLGGQSPWVAALDGRRELWAAKAQDALHVE